VLDGRGAVGDNNLDSGVPCKRSAAGAVFEGCPARWLASTPEAGPGRETLMFKEAIPVTVDAAGYGIA
jgi:hypothetical protein